MNNIFPNIKIIQKNTKNFSNITNIELDTWVRIKRKKVWYEVHVIKLFTIFNNKIIIKDIIKYTQQFMYDCELVRSCYKLPKNKKKYIEKFSNKFKISKTQLKETDRIYIKRMVETNQLNSIL